ncbi:MAG TPA: O-antigen ligase family protein [Synergistales bacterium]|nr:O-antigen ligase family protein [Synergistales bacterium]
MFFLTKAFVLFFPMNIGLQFGGHNFFLYRIIALVFIFLYFFRDMGKIKIPISPVIWSVFGAVFFSIFRIFSGYFDPKLLNFLLSVAFAYCFARYITGLPKEKATRLLPFLSKCSIINDFLALVIYVVGLKMGVSLLGMMHLDVNPNYFGYLRLAGLWGDPNYFALFAIVFSVFNLYNISNSPKKIFRFAYLLNCLTIVLTFSRSGWLIFLLLNMTSFSFWKKTRNIILFTILVISLVTIFVPIARESIDQRLGSTYKTLGTSSSREVLWLESLAKFFSVDDFSETGHFEKWAIGTGVGSQYFLLEREYGVPKVPHNTYIDFLIEHGFVGIFFIFMPLLSLISVRRYKNREAKITGVLLLIAIGGMGMFLSFSASPLPFIFYFLSFNYPPKTAKCKAIGERTLAPEL